MAQMPITEVATGIVDGININFQTSADYIPGSLNIYVDGQLKRRDFNDGFEELGSNDFKMKVAPKLGSVVQARYTSVV